MLNIASRLEGGRGGEDACGQGCDGGGEKEEGDGFHVGLGSGWVQEGLDGAFLTFKRGFDSWVAVTALRLSCGVLGGAAEAEVQRGFPQVGDFGRFRFWFWPVEFEESIPG